MEFVCTIGEMLVEIMRSQVNATLHETGEFVGPYPSGAPAIFIDAMARLGVPSAIVSCVGEDAFGRCVMERLARDGVDVSQVVVSKDKTTAMAFVTYFESGEREFLFHIADAAAGQVEPTQLERAFLENVRILHLSGSSMAINQNMWDTCVEAAKVVKENGGVVTFDPNVRVELLTPDEAKERYLPFLSLCDYVLPSTGEAELITGMASLEYAIRVLFNRGVKAVVCKRGDAGCELYTPEESISVPALPVDVVDPTGAGDCFSAGFAYGLVEGWDWWKTLTFANAMGAMATTKQGPMEGCEPLQNVLAFLGW